MMLAALLESAGTLLTVLTPLVAVPLTIITFYLRSLREHQISWHGDFVRRISSVEASITDLRRAMADFERDFTTKEEWLRECMLARRSIEELSQRTIRIETRMQTFVYGDLSHGSGERQASASPPAVGIGGNDFGDRDRGTR